MIVDTREITKLLLNDEYSIYSIAKAIDVTRSTLNIYRQKQDENYIKEMSLDLAIKLQRFINEEAGKMVYVIMGFVNYYNGNQDIRDFGVEDYPETLEEVLDDIENDLSNVSGKSQGGIKNVEYLIYQVENNKLNDDLYMEKLYDTGTNYSITYNGKFKIEKINVAGLEYAGEEVKQGEGYKVIVNNFKYFVDELIYDLRNNYDGVDLIPPYETLEDHASTLLQAGRIDDAYNLLKDEILDFNNPNKE